MNTECVAICNKCDDADERNTRQYKLTKTFQYFSVKSLQTEPVAKKHAQRFITEQKKREEKRWNAPKSADR